MTLALRRIAGYTFAFLIVTLVATLLIGHVLGTPFLLGYVETDSMEPALEPGDGYVAIPIEIAGPVGEGDVVTFDAQELHGASLTTHRIVDETSEGYVTKGDANLVVDQEGAEPPVTDGQIEAKLLKVNGEVVVIPNLGTVVTTIQDGLESVQLRLGAILGTTALRGTQGLAYLAFALGSGLLLWGYASDRGRHSRDSQSRDRSRKYVYDVRTVVIVLALVVCVASVGTMAANSGTEEYDIISAEYDSDRADIIEQGTTETISFPSHNGGLLPIVTVFEPASDGVEIEPRRHYLTHGESAEATLVLTAPAETGYYVRSVAEYRYFAVLPPSAILALHAIHPWLATTAVTGTIVVVFMLPILIIIGFDGVIRTRERNRNGPSKSL